MIVVLQRVSSAQVVVEGEMVARTGMGFLALVGVKKGDGEAEGELLSRKVAGLRVFNDDRGRMNRDILHVEVGGEVLAVSQFTLLADCTRGRRPGFDPAEEPAEAGRLFDFFVKSLRARGVPVSTGRFGAVMEVSLRNEGPVTIILDTESLARTK